MTAAIIVVKSRICVEEFQAVCKTSRLSMVNGYQRLKAIHVDAITLNIWMDSFPSSLDTNCFPLELKRRKEMIIQGYISCLRNIR